MNREIYPPVSQDPSALFSKLDNGALGIEEEEVFRVGDGEGRVSFLGAVGDFASDGADKDLFRSKCFSARHRVRKKVRHSSIKTTYR